MGQDIDGANWQALGNRYWPTPYLVDNPGHIRYIHMGEGRYTETERAMEALLAE